LSLISFSVTSNSSGILDTPEISCADANNPGPEPR
jgi:hypothetical protein